MGGYDRVGQLGTTQGRYLMTENRAVTRESIRDKIESHGTSRVEMGAVNQAKYISAVLHSKLGCWFMINTGAIPIPQNSHSRTAALHTVGRSNASSQGRRSGGGHLRIRGEH